MSQQHTPTKSPEQQAAARPFDPGHVMTRLHYERLAREAAGQK